MPDSPKVLVVGTTTDYVDWIRDSCPERALFLTDPFVRHEAQEPNPSPHEEVLCDLADHDQAEKALRIHLRKWGLTLDGIASYDCESMALAALLAPKFSLDYPSAEAVANSRNKSLSKTLWRQRGVNCPLGSPVGSVSEAVDFFKERDGGCVLKPTCGSGSELVFHCKSVDECEKGFHDLSNGLRQRQASLLYGFTASDHPGILAEEYVEGEEYSCDFMVENGRVEVIRLCRKIRDKLGPFGTIRGYVLPASLPDEIGPDDFHEALRRGAEALGFFRAICMADFLIRENEVVFLEMTPRPGGDCLPFLIRRIYNLDMLKLNLDFAQRRPVQLQWIHRKGPSIGLRVHARQGGLLKKIDAASLRQDLRVSEIHLPWNPGHFIRMPPADYDSWVLGHIIFSPTEGTDLEAQCDEIVEKIFIEIQ
jgi:biotin carboxylase